MLMYDIVCSQLKLRKQKFQMRLRRNMKANILCCELLIFMNRYIIFMLADRC